MKINPNKDRINVRNQESDPNSILSWFKAMVALRKAEKGLVYGDLRLLDKGADTVLTIEREHGQRILTIVINFSGEPVTNPVDMTNHELLISNSGWENRSILSPWQAVVTCR